MNRRNFLNGILTLTAGFTILPAATKYIRPRWLKTKSGLFYVNPDFVSVCHETSFIVPKEVFEAWCRNMIYCHKLILDKDGKFVPNLEAMKLV